MRVTTQFHKMLFYYIIILHEGRRFKALTIQHPATLFITHTAPMPPTIQLYTTARAVLTNLNCRSNYATLKTNIKVSSTSFYSYSFHLCRWPCKSRRIKNQRKCRKSASICLPHLPQYSACNALLFLFVLVRQCQQHHKMNVNKIQFNFAVNKSCEANEIIVL